MYCINFNLRVSFLLVICLLYFSCNSDKNNHKILKYVDPFIGTENGGHTFVGATLPFGMVKLGPDYGERQSNSGYYEPWYMQNQTNNNPNNGLDTLRRDLINQRIQGFSHIHVSGTGGGPKYGNILVKPCIGNIDSLIFDYSSYRDSFSEGVRPGYYSVILNKHNKIKVELTASNNVGFHRYTFINADSGYILLDITSFLGKYHCCGENQELVNHSIKIIDNQTLCGYSTVRGGWNKGEPYTVYFYAGIDKKASSFGAWKNGNIYIPEVKSNDTIAHGVFYRFDFTDTSTINVKVGISFLNIDKARKNFIEDHNTFDQTVNKAEDIWESYLSGIIVETPFDSLKTIFYTALYHCLLMPVNRTGENPKWVSDEPYYDDFYAIWDTYRTLHPLYTIIAPEEQQQILRSLIDIYIHEGYMPDARSGNSNGRTQGGSNSDILFAEAYLKKLGIDNINYHKAFESMIKNAEISPLDNFPGNLSADDSIYITQKHGRYINDFYKTNGYFPADYYKNNAGEYFFKVERPGTRTMEYAYCDWAISNIAQDFISDSLMKFYSDTFNINNLKSYYLNRSGGWKKLWNRSFSCDDISGFIYPKNSQGEWVHYIPDGRGNIVKYTCNLDGSWRGFFYESDSWENSLFVPHDITGLIEICGGQKIFEKRLDIFFNDGHYNVKNEPSFFTPFLYIWINKPNKTTERIRHIIKQHYNIGRGGLPGNDDAGAISSWFVFNSIGLYPIAGTDEYLILSPLFNEVTIKVNNGYFVIKAKNLNDTNIYVRNKLLHGEELQGYRIKHSEITKGGELKLIMQSN